MISPVILVLPGGGYGRLADHEGGPVADWLESLGWRARVVEYPVLTRHPGPLDAVQSVIREERAAGAPVIGALGFSAGGHLAGHAALVGAGDTALDFAVLCYPVVNMLTTTHAGSRENLLGPEPSDELRRATSLQLLVTPHSPPMFLWSTTDDASVPIDDHIYVLGAALARNGVPHDMHVFDNGGPHGMGLGPGTLTGEQWTRLAGEWLGKRLP